MENTKREQCTLLVGYTPYFNEREFIVNLNKYIKDCDELSKMWILWKGEVYNKIISEELESILVILRRTWGIGAMKAEYCAFKGVEFTSKLKNAYSELKIGNTNI